MGGVRSWGEVANNSRRKSKKEGLGKGLRENTLVSTFFPRVWGGEMRVRWPGKNDLKIS